MKPIKDVFCLLENNSNGDNFDVGEILSIRFCLENLFV